MRYSVVIPVLNGGETLPLTLGHLLNIDYEDFEVVVSDNHSSDNTSLFLESIKDPRLKIVSPPKRIGWSENLAFAYSHATGDWQFHIGDDDVVLPSRFRILDQILEEVPEADVLWTRHFRYYWPSYNKKELANTVDKCSFTGLYSVIDHEYLIKLIRGITVDAGCCLTVHRSLIKRTIDRYGFWQTAQHGEAFSHRAALFNSTKVVALDLPLAIMGRHSKSIATQHLQSKDHYGKKGETDISHSDPDDFPYTPWKYKGYVSWSLSALRTLINYEKRIPDLKPREWATWFYMTLGETRSLNNKKQIFVSDDSIIADAKSYEPFNYNLRLRTNKDILFEFDDNSIWKKFSSGSHKSSFFTVTLHSQNCASWSISNISQLAHHLEEKYPLFYGTPNLLPKFKSVTSSGSQLFANLKKYVSLFEESEGRRTKEDKSANNPDSSQNPCQETSFEAKNGKFLSVISDFAVVEGPLIKANCVMPYKYESIEHLSKDLGLSKKPITALSPQASAKYLERLNSIEGSSNNRSALILGNGPSLDMLDQDSVNKFIEEGNHVYRMNHAFDDVNSLPMTHYVSADFKMFSKSDPDHLPRVKKVHQKLEKENITVFVPVKMIAGAQHSSEYLAPNTEIIYFETSYTARHHGGGWKPNASRCYWSNTLLFTMALCRFQNYKSIYICGADCNYHQCITVTPFNHLGMIENHSGLPDRFREGYPMTESLSDYFSNLAFWHWSFDYVGDHRFRNLDPLSMIDAISKFTSNDMDGSQLLNAKALRVVAETIKEYSNCLPD